GIDYRDKPVIASIRHIPDSPWYMVAKIDKDELYEPLKKLYFLTFFLILGIMVITAMVMVIIQRSNSTKHYRILYETQQKTQAALVESEQFISTIISSAQEGVIVYDRTFRYKVWNGFMERLTGISFDALEGKNAFAVFPHLRENRIEELLNRVLDGETVQSPDTPFTVPATGKNGWVASTYGPHRTADGTIIGIVAIVKDITERKLAEDAMANQKEQLAVTLRSIGDGVISTDNAGRILLMNRVAESLTGWPLEQARGKPLSEVFNIINELTRKPCPNPVEKVLQTGTVISLENHTMLISRTGREMVIVDSGAPIKDKDSITVGVVLVFRDNTEKQKAFENMIKTEKLESIGLLAGGIAHDFNNLLGGLFGYVDLARELAGDNQTVVAPLSKALKVFNRARDLTRQLLTFSKGGIPSKNNTSLGPIITDMARFALSGSNIQCVFSIPNDLWSCNVDENQIGQVIDNIVINAQQAMPQGGEIALAAENVVLKKSGTIPLPDGRYVKISIRDSGVGIPRDHLQKIFDPFFTTK
ncbi:MAG TPA: PAS domain S-box protein, partial [Chitinivibrionales bacterium]